VSAALIAVAGKVNARFEAVIASKLEAGLSASASTRIWLAKAALPLLPVVKRYVQKLKSSEPRRVWRVESRPGEEMQVDFGLGAPLELGAGKTRRSWVFRVS